MKILLLDIETAPNTAYVWGLFKENVPLARLIETGFVMCWSAKWYGKKEVMFGSIMNGGKKKMLKGIHDLLDEADVVVHFNGRSFDIPSLNREFLTSGMFPPSPYKQVDIYQVVRAKFRFVSNKLDHVAGELDCGQKHATDFKLWVDCMNKEPKAWRRMERYNKRDVVVLERVYRKVLPWISNHPNHGLYAGRGVCPSCGSGKLQLRGVARRLAGTYRRYQCQKCGSWSHEGSVKAGSNSLLRKEAA